MNQNDLPIKVLWSGGWDSTYRVLYLLLMERRKVQPYYVVDHQRESTPQELKAMESIREDLFRIHPETRNLLLPTIFGHRKQIGSNAEITRKWQEFHEKADLGTQYEWLPRYAEQEGLEELEMCHEKWAHPTRFDNIIFPELTGEGHDCRIQDQPQNEIVEIFKYFRFPICFVTKVEMENTARENGFFELLKKTWFCHTPRKNGAPCEVCHPCRVTRGSGRTHNLARSNFIRDKWREIVFRWSRILRQVAVKSGRIIPKLIRLSRERMDHLRGVH